MSRFVITAEGRLKQKVVKIIRGKKYRLHFFFFVLKTAAAPITSLESAFSPTQQMLSLYANLQSSQPPPGNHSLFPNRTAGSPSVAALPPSGARGALRQRPGTGPPRRGEAPPRTGGPSGEEEGSSFGREAPLPERAPAGTETTSCAEVSQVMKSRLHGKEAPPTAQNLAGDRNC